MENKSETEESVRSNSTDLDTPRISDDQKSTPEDVNIPDVKPIPTEVMKNLQTVIEEITLEKKKLSIGKEKVEAGSTTLENMYKLDLLKNIDLQLTGVIGQYKALSVAAEYESLLYAKYKTIEKHTCKIDETTEALSEKLTLENSKMNLLQVEICDLKERIEQGEFAQTLDRELMQMEKQLNDEINTASKSNDNTELKCNPRVAHLNDLIENFLSKDTVYLNLAKVLCVDGMEKECKEGEIEYVTLQGQLARVQSAQGLHQEAVTSWDAALAGAKILKDRQLIASLTGSLASYYRNRKKYEKALQYIDETIENVEVLGAAIPIADQIAVKASILCDAGQLVEAIKLYEGVEVLYESTYAGHDVKVVQIKYTLAQMHFKNNDFKEAERILNEIIPLYYDGVQETHDTDSTIIDLAAQAQQKTNGAASIEFVEPVNFDKMPNSRNAFKLLGDVYVQTKRHEAFKVIKNFLAPRPEQDTTPKFFI